MIIKEIILKNFKNYNEENIKLDHQVTLLSGDNGSGKTNLLEAIYYLQTLKPFRHAELIQWGNHEGAIIAIKKEENKSIRYSVLLSKNERKLKIEDETIKTVDKFLKGNPTVAFLPQHLWIIKGEPSLRREYLDRSIFNCNFNYLHIIREYKRVLKQRNALLKQWINPVDQEIWDEQLIKSATPVIKERLKFIKKIAPIATEIYNFLSSTKDILTLSYDMSKDGIDSEEGLVKQGEERLRSLALKERVWQHTLWGPQRHDLRILLNGHSIGEAGSQGEQRLGIIALKLAEIELLSQNGIYPLILLDDLASELDPIRRSLVLSYLQRCEHQMVLTTCEPSQWQLDGAKTVTKYRVCHGHIMAIS